MADSELSWSARTAKALWSLLYARFVLKGRIHSRGRPLPGRRQDFGIPQQVGKILSNAVTLTRGLKRDAVNRIGQWFQNKSTRPQAGLGVGCVEAGTSPAFRLERAVQDLVLLAPGSLQRPRLIKGRRSKKIQPDPAIRR